jgi:hypothetical protein
MRFTLPVTLLALLTTMPAQAQQSDAQSGIEVDTNLICDTPQQVEWFVSLFNGDSISAEAAIAAINQESKATDACVIATTAYRRAGAVATVKNGDATFDVMRIVVVGVYTLKGMEQSLPTEFFTLVPQEDPSTTVGQR